jgi:hypothetical protein
MSASIDHSEPAHYEICIRGRLSRQAAAWFEGMTLTFDDSQSPPQTIVSGYVRDQTVLYGLISRARDLGLTLVSVRRTQP